MTRLRRAALVTAVLGGIAACDDPMSARSDVLVARLDRRGLELVNRTPDRIYYFAAERGILTVLDWIPCIDPRTCAAVEGSARRVVPLAAVAGYEAGDREVVVFHWRLVRHDAAYRPDSIRQVMVRLR